MLDNTLLTRGKVGSEEESDVELRGLSEQVLSPERSQCVFYKNQGVLMRKWRPPDALADNEWQIHHQTKQS